MAKDPMKVTDMDRAYGVKNALSGYSGPSTAKQQQDMIDKYGAAPAGKELWAIKNGKAEWKTPEEAEAASKDFLDYNTPEGRAYFNQQLESAKKSNEAEYLNSLKPKDTTKPTGESDGKNLPPLEFSKPPTIAYSSIPQEAPKNSGLGNVSLSTPSNTGISNTLSESKNNKSDSDVLKDYLKGTETGKLSSPPVVGDFSSNAGDQLRTGILSDQERSFYYDRTNTYGRSGNNRLVKIKGIGELDPKTGLIVNK